MIGRWRRAPGNGTHWLANRATDTETHRSSTSPMAHANANSRLVHLPATMLIHVPPHLVQGRGPSWFSHRVTSSNGSRSQIIDMDGLHSHYIALIWLLVTFGRSTRIRLRRASSRTLPGRGLLHDIASMTSGRPLAHPREARCKKPASRSGRYFPRSFLSWKARNGYL
jgi:hypothetical protein